MLRQFVFIRLLKGCWKVLLLLCAAAIFTMMLQTDRRPTPPPPYQCLANETVIVDDLDRNKAIIDSYKFPNIEMYVDGLGLRDKVEPVSRDVPVIATGSSANHFAESFQLLQNLKTKLFDSYDDIQIFYYDLGLTSAQREKIKHFPRVSLVSFPFSYYPDHVSRMKGFAWKPIIIQMLLQQYGFVMWMDASMRLIYANLNELFRVTKENGITFRFTAGPLLDRTDIDTFKFLNENPCNFKQYTQVEANLVLVYRTQFINDYIMRPVVSCALSFGCLVTRNSAAIKQCHHKLQPHVCHRLDQSVFSIVLRRLFQGDNRFLVPEDSGIYVCRGPDYPVQFLPEIINQQIIDIKMFFDPKNHARCASGTRWYKPAPGNEG